MSKKCPYCANENNEDDAKFCTSCGRAIPDNKTVEINRDEYAPQNGDESEISQINMQNDSVQCTIGISNDDIKKKNKMLKSVFPLTVFSLVAFAIKAILYFVGLADVNEIKELIPYFEETIAQKLQTYASLFYVELFFAVLIVIMLTVACVFAFKTRKVRIRANDCDMRGVFKKEYLVFFACLALILAYGLIDVLALLNYLKLRNVFDAVDRGFMVNPIYVFVNYIGTVIFVNVMIYCMYGLLKCADEFIGRKPIVPLNNGK